MALGILGDFVRNGHVEHASEHPTGLVVFGAHQAPIVHRHRCGGFVSGLIASGGVLGSLWNRESLPIRGQFRRGRHGRRSDSSRWLTPYFCAAEAFAQNRLRSLRSRLRARRELMGHHVDFAVFRYLPKAGRSTARFSVHVQQFENRRRALRWILGGALGHVAKAVHLVRREKLAQIGPAFYAFWAAHPDQAMFVFEDIEFLSVLDRGRDGRTWRSNRGEG